MKPLDICPGCHFYARSHLLVCAVHPAGVEGDRCNDYQCRYAFDLTQISRMDYQEQLGGNLTLDLMQIPAGKFVMGAPQNETKADSIMNEGLLHRVQVPAFAMGKYPVTQAQWYWVSNLPKVEHVLVADPSHFKGANHPVEMVTWYDAMEFCARLSRYSGREYRLPSEAEWEYACRAGTTTPFHFGEILAPQIANFDLAQVCGRGMLGCGIRGFKIVRPGPWQSPPNKTTPVGHYQVSNAFGLYDMHGNVFEWCLDHKHESYDGAPTDGSAWVTGGDDTQRIGRGGAWGFCPWQARAAHRNCSGPDKCEHQLGFRVCCVLS